MSFASESIPVHCKCGLLVKVPIGGKRLCGCGNWVLAPGDAAQEKNAPVVLKAAELTPMSTWPKIEGDLSAIERLNDGYRRITREISKAIVGQRQVLEEMLI